MNKTLYPKYSVVMAAYKNDKPEWFRDAVDSMLAQTVKADEIIVVIDGPIPTALRESIMSYGDKIKAVWLTENQGLWNALNVGIETAKNELIARMDSDDISAAYRAEKQLREFYKNKKLSIISGTVAEFEKSIDKIISYRKLPTSHSEIVKFSKYRSPFNHPAVMFKKSAVLSVGKYSKLLRSEDYDLWIRLLMNGYVAKNLADPLLYYRVSAANRVRKNTLLQQRELLILHKKYYNAGFLTLSEYIKACSIRIVFALLPGRLKGAVYSTVLRK